MTTDLDPEWIDDTATYSTKPTPLEVALWLDSFTTYGKVMSTRFFVDRQLEHCLRAWPPRARA